MKTKFFQGSEKNIQLLCILLTCLLLVSCGPNQQEQEKIIGNKIEITYKKFETQYKAMVAIRNTNYSFEGNEPSLQQLQLALERSKSALAELRSIQIQVKDGFHKDIEDKLTVKEKEIFLLRAEMLTKEKITALNMINYSNQVYMQKIIASLLGQSNKKQESNPAK